MVKEDLSLGVLQVLDKHGDPLSPIFLNLVADVISALLCKASTEGRLDSSTIC